MDLISTRLNSKMFIVRMTMRMTMTVIILAIRTCVDITALNGSYDNMTYLALQPKNHWSWDKCSTKTWSNICNGQVIEKHRGSISDGQIFLAVLSSLTLSYSSSSPPFDLEIQTWESRKKFFNHQHLTFTINIVTFLPSEFLTKSRNNPTKLQVTCPSWLWLCASIMQSIL